MSGKTDTLGLEALEVFRDIPIDQAASTDDLAHARGREAALRHFRNLLAHGLVKAESQRPLRVRVAEDPFALAFHGTLRSKPFVAPILSGSNLRVIAALIAKPGANAVELAKETGLHPNTVRNDLKQLADRGLLLREKRGFRIADHARDFEDLARFYIQYEFKQKLPRREVILRRGRNDLVMVVESKEPLELPTTAACRFQEEGADVLPARFQYRIHALRDETQVPLEEALADAEALGTAPRTLTTMHQFLATHG